MRESFNTTLPQFDALAELIYFDRPLSMTELSARLKVSNGNITGLVDRLVRDSYAERVPDENDRRVNLIVVTDYGREAFDKMASAHEAWIEEIFSGLSLQKINTMSSILKETQSIITR